MGTHGCIICVRCGGGCSICQRCACPKESRSFARDDAGWEIHSIGTLLNELEYDEPQRPETD
jgi:hypothetical protein